jgi:hypothetical protein
MVRPLGQPRPRHFFFLKRHHQRVSRSGGAPGCPLDLGLWAGRRAERHALTLRVALAAPRFLFRLETVDGVAGDAPTLASVVPTGGSVTRSISATERFS